MPTDQIVVALTIFAWAFILGFFMSLLLPVAEVLLLLAGFFCAGRLAWHVLWRGHISREVKKFRRELDVDVLV